MAGARLEITVDDAEVQQVLGDVQAALAPGSLAELLGELGEYLMGSTRDRATLEVAPDGTPWPALSPPYARRKAKKRPNAPLLVFDRHLLGDRLAWQVDGETLYVGTGAPYGARQQFGGGGIPPRPWLGYSDDDRTEIRERITDFIRAAVDGNDATA